jgi:hypothetical protein
MSQIQYSSYPGYSPEPGPRSFGEIPSLWMKVTQITEAWFAQEAPLPDYHKSGCCLGLMAHCSRHLLGLLWGYIHPSPRRSGYRQCIL